MHFPSVQLIGFISSVPQSFFQDILPPFDFFIKDTHHHTFTSKLTGFLEVGLDISLEIPKFIPVFVVYLSFNSLTNRLFA